MTEDQKKYQNHTHSNKTKDVKVRDMDCQLWQEFKAQAALFNISLKDHVMSAIRMHMKKFNKP